MKHIKKLALLLIAVLGMSSCDLLNVDVDSTLSGVLDINVEEDMAKSTLVGHDFSEMSVIDAQEDDNVQKYSNNIDNITVNDITAVVESLSVENVTLLAGTTFYILNDNDSIPWPLEEDWLIDDESTYPMVNLGTTYDDVSAIILDAATSEEEDGGNFTIGVVGECSQDGVHIRIRIDIQNTITGGLL